MIHDPDLLDQLARITVESFSGQVFRATRKSLDPLAPSANGGRWMPKGHASILYTSLHRDGALAELTYHWGMLDPLPKNSATISKIGVGVSATIQILRAELQLLGVPETDDEKARLSRMQQIGAAAEFLDIHGILVLSIRWDCENLVIFPDKLLAHDSIELLETEEIEWQAWGRENGLPLD